MSGALSFQLLGRLAVLDADGNFLDLGGPQPRLVLARLLAAQGRVVPVDSLLDALWGDDLPDTASGTLQSYVSRLRRTLGPGGVSLLRRENAGYRLDVGADQVDVRRFEQLSEQGGRLLLDGDHSAAARVLHEALELWRDVPAGPDGADPHGLGPVWTRWQEMRSIALENFFDAELRLGRSGSLVADLIQAVEDAPLREGLRGLLALALYRSGRQADALAVLDAGRRLLDEELGLEPSRELRELRGRILDQAGDLDAPQQRGGRGETGPGGDGSVRSVSDLFPTLGFAATGATVKAPAPAVVAVSPPVQGRAAQVPRRVGDRLSAVDPAQSPLVGRVAELAVLKALWNEVRSFTEPRFVIVEGEPGMGKSRLARALLESAVAEGAQIVSVGTLETGAAPAYGPWLQLVRSARAQHRGLPESAGALLEHAEQLPQGSSAVAVASTLADSVAWPRPFGLWPTWAVWCSCSRICSGPTLRRWICCPRWASNSWGRRCCSS